MKEKLRTVIDILLRKDLFINTSNSCLMIHSIYLEEFRVELPALSNINQSEL